MTKKMAQAAALAALVVAMILLPLLPAMVAVALTQQPLPPAKEKGNAWAEAAAVRIEHHVTESPSSTLIQGGSGSTVHRDEHGGAFYVLTCRHNFETRDGKFAAGTITVWQGGKKYRSVKVVAGDRPRDLALLRVKSADRVPVAEVAQDEAYRAGTGYVTCGWPAWKKATLEGKCLDWFTTTQEGHKSFASSIPAAQGASGGGVYRLSDRKLVGVLRGGTQEAAISVRIEDVRHFLLKAALPSDDALASAAWAPAKK